MKIKARLKLHNMKWEQFSSIHHTSEMIETETEPRNVPHSHTYLSWVFELDQRPWCNKQSSLVRWQIGSSKIFSSRYNYGFRHTGKLFPTLCALEQERSIMIVWRKSCLLHSPPPWKHIRGRALKIYFSTGAFSQTDTKVESVPRWETTI